MRCICRVTVSLPYYDALRREGETLRSGIWPDLRSLMMLRLEKSFPAWGTELSPDYLAHEWRDDAPCEN